MSDLLLATKTRVPVLRRQLVGRAHLIHRLNEAISLNKPLTLISAPAGYGKSTLLAEWVAQLDCAVAWLTLEKGENDPARFWSYLLNALQTVPTVDRTGTGRSLLEALQSPQPERSDPLVAGLLNDLSRLEEDVVLVLDDLHYITSPEIHEGLAFLIEHLPVTGNSLHVVVAGRVDPPWPLARMRARAQITELRSKDLRFTLEETAAFLNEVMGLTLSAADVARLDQRTEGWIAGLQLAALSMQNRADISSFLERFSGSHRYILDYLIEEVLDQQTPRVLDFLLRTSILDTLTAPLCDAVTGLEGSQELLVQLERSNVFLSCMDDEQRWYRYHPLFADLLRKRLSTSHPGQIQELHRLASQWYEAHGVLRESILHAIDADDMKEVARLVSGNILILAESQALPELIDRIRPLEPEDICSRPWLCVAVAWVKAYAGEMEEAQALIGRMERESVPLVEETERSHLLGHLMTIKAYIGWVMGQFELAAELAQDALSKIPVDDEQEKANILIVLGLATQNALRHHESIQALNEAISASVASGNRYLQIYAASCLVFALRLAGQLHLAYDTSEQAIRIAGQERSGQGPFVLSIGLAARSQVRRTWNDLQGALEDAQHAVTLAEQWRQVDTLHYALSVLTEAYLATNDLDAARPIIERSKRIARNVSSWFMEISARQEAELNLACGNWDQVLQWKETVVPVRKKGSGVYSILGRILIAQDNASEALGFIDEGILQFQDSGVRGYLLELYVLKAIALALQGREEVALSTLRESLEMAEPEGYVQVFVSQGKPMSSLLRRAVRKGIHPEYAGRLLDIMTTGPAHPRRAGVTRGDQGYKGNGALIEPLSDKEHEVLRLLNSELSVPEIAQELTVAPSTVRTHVRVIYGKLGVHGRLEAIRRARELDLV